MDNISYGRGVASRRGMSLKTILNVTVTLMAVQVFLMAHDQIDPIFAKGFLVLALAAFLMEWLGMGHPPRLVVNLAAPAALFMIFTRVRLDYIIEALLEALMLMLAVKILESKRSRDYVQIAGLGLGAVVTYAMMTVEKIFLAHSVGIGLTSSMILLLAAWFDRDEYAEISYRELRQLFGRAGVIFGLMIPVCVLIFLGLPRTGSPFFGFRGAFGGVAVGFSDQLRLGSASQILVNDRMAFRAEMEELNLPYLYWRGAVLDFFDGNLWASSRRPRASYVRKSFVPEPDARVVEQAIFLEPGNRGQLIALDRPISVTETEVIAGLDGTFRFTGRGIGRRLQYRAVSVISRRMEPYPRQIDSRRYLLLPNGFMPELAALVADITQGRTHDEKISEIMRFLSPPGFTYSLDALPYGRDALERFIFEYRRGNCEYFASAMGVMLRMAGIPARLVTGYFGGTYNRAGGYYIVLERNAHVWVEAWNEAEGVWVRYDPTPPSEEYTGFIWSMLSMYLDFLEFQWARLVLNYSYDAQSGIMQSLMEAMSSPRSSLIPGLDAFRRIGGVFMGLAVVLAVLVICAALFYVVKYIKKRSPEIALLNEFLRAMKRNGYSKHESEGLSEFLARVDDTSLNAAAAPFVREFEKLYFTDAPLDAPTRRQLKGYINDIAGK